VSSPKGGFPGPLSPDTPQAAFRRRKMKSLTDFQIEYTKYKWEFLRRNRDYIEDWKTLQDSLENKYGDWDPPDGRYTNEEASFCKKWKIGKPINPYVSYDEWIELSVSDKLDDTYYINFAPGEGVLSKGIDYDRLMYDWLNPELLLGLPVKILDGWEYEHDGQSIHRYVSDKLAKNGKLTVEIDLNFSKTRLIKEFKILLNEWNMLYEDAYRKKIYKDFCKERDIHSFPIDDNLMKEFEKIYKKKLKQRKQKYAKKYHFDNFDDYLKVYDLREKKVSWANITKNLGLNSVQTARNHHKAACEIIDKGIELYVK
jgi:hypothetical protein